MASREKNILEIDIVEVPEDEKPASHYKHFKDLSRKQQTHRLEVIWKLVKAIAEQQKLTVEETLGFLLTWNGNSNTAQSYGKNLFQSDPESTKLPLATAVTVYLDCNLGRTTYNTQRKLLSANGFDIFPKWESINSYRKQITPKMSHLEFPFEGVCFDFLPAFEMTTKRLLEAVEMKADKLVVKTKYGFDDSGIHAIYHQKNNSQTNNMILSVF